MYAGQFLQSTSLLEGSIFDGVIITLTTHNTEGAVGFVVNKLHPRKLNELTEFKQCVSFPLYEGGPVDQEHLFVLHRRPDLIENGQLINGGIYFGGDFKQAIDHINAGRMATTDIKLFIGYCGWDTDELESEIAEGSWVLMNNGNVFSE